MGIKCWKQSTSERAQALVQSWLAPGGLLGDYASLSDDKRAMFGFLAPVEPEKTLAAIERSLSEVLSTPKSLVDDPLGDLVPLLRWLAYDPERFARAVGQLTRILVVRDDDSSISEKFSALFWLTLSGTRAGPNQRLVVIDDLVRSDDEQIRRLGFLAVKAMLKVTDFHTLNLGTIGARVRDLGWRPKTDRQTIEWLTSVVARLRRMIQQGGARAREARTILATRFADLWRLKLVSDELEQMMRVAGSDSFWAEGYIAVCKALAGDGKKKASASDRRLLELRDQMQPSDLVERVRVFVLPETHRPFDLAEIEARENGQPMDVYRAAERRAVNLGEALAGDAAALLMLLPDLLRSASRRVWALGQGLAQASDNPAAVWRELIAVFTEMSLADRRPTLPIGFLVALHEREPKLVDDILDHVVMDSDLALHFAQFQTAVPIDKAGVRRLRMALNMGLAPTVSFEPLAFGRATDAIDADDLAGLIDAIALKPDGYFIALHIMSMRLSSDFKPAVIPPDERLVACGRGLLLALPLDRNDARLRELELVAKICLKGEEAVAPARELCRRLLDSNGEKFRNWRLYERLVLAIFASQPCVALDEFTDPQLLEDDGRLWFGLQSVVVRAIDEVPKADLIEWLAIDPQG